MRRRILAAILATTALALLLCGIPLAVVLARSEARGETLSLEREAIVAAGSVSITAFREADIPELPESASTMFALYDATGRRIAGTGPVRGDRFVVSALHSTIVSGEVDEHLVASVPIAADEVVVGALRAERSLASSDARVLRAWVFIVGFAALVLVVAFVVGRILADRIAQHVRRVRAAAISLGDGGFSIAHDPSGIVELDDVTDALRVTAERLERTLRRERQLSADVSHQLRTPLTGLRLILENEIEGPREQPGIALAEALGEVDRMEATIHDLLELARQSATASVGGTDLVAAAQRAARRWRPALERDGRTCALALVPALGAASRTSAVDQALDVLLENAIRHGRGTVTIEAYESPGGATLVVSDEGPGLEMAGEALFARGTRETTDTGGLGIGLNLARSLIEAEGGRLVVQRAKPFAAFAIVLPVGHR